MLYPLEFSALKYVSRRQKIERANWLLNICSHYVHQIHPCNRLHKLLNYDVCRSESRRRLLGFLAAKPADGLDV